MEAVDIKGMDFPTLQETFSADIAPGGEIIDALPYAMDLSALNQAMDRYAGSSVNPRRVRLSDFEFVVIRYDGPTGVVVFFVHRRTGRRLLSQVGLWAGPRGDYWTVSTELSGLDIPQRSE